MHQPLRSYQISLDVDQGSPNIIHKGSNYCSSDLRGGGQTVAKLWSVIEQNAPVPDGVYKISDVMVSRR